MCAILTNSFVPCNGRFPTLILLGSLFFPGAGAALGVAACVALGVVGAIAVSGLLNKTVLKEKESAFVMELPPFRRPRLGKIIMRSLRDRTLGITVRALKVAAPAGGILWLAGNTGLLQKMAAFLQLPGTLLGMNGALLLAFLFSLPANELLIPVLLMTLTEAGSIYAVSTGSVLTQYLSWQNAVCTMVFTLFHWPCATTLMTVYRETGSKKTTVAAFLLPTTVGCSICFLLNWLL
jgi:ferrous iron transport protein B